MEGLIMRGTRLHFVEVHPAGVAGVLADHSAGHLVFAAGLEPGRSVVHVDHVDLDGGGGGE